MPDERGRVRVELTSARGVHVRDKPLPGLQGCVVDGHPRCRYDMWGMGNHENEDDMQTMMERMIRMSGGGYHSSPEKKQVERLMQRKLGLVCANRRTYYVG
jgi:hypothetical protein